ncbi:MULTISPECIES: geranylgeranylglyceryl/heptaprenylglyceryl phosphate synthase [Tenacibaculum]|uniref:geranylgeranylglyceryl/heptaprenylglyceryl phosphate synthase n=1 Tax=Tenacibaculum TaxID=104267 RepID=UPI001F0AC97D|nr:MULTISPECIES: geranylgeranylglyceryl/heptaprenylglyceryl phosphate synthase [Tenacibaculum]MCH3881739.1 geranylgeranylglyceryl/heptaprenylglyceryl phosphate synthase [Tenacibaculum aquimarinum]MDO6598693.1 geranylgeranylglyceryl/heptaprenylglyceryl phosphate synthase [Tenacibaculum sp. 1_MG-2023]
MKNIYQNIISAKTANKKLLAVLIDPEKFDVKNSISFFEKVHQSITTHIFVGGSTDKNNQTESVVSAIKKATDLPIILFPGDVKQITNKADGILFLSLISGRNPEYLIEQQVAAAPILKKATLEILPTGYILIDGGTKTATQKVSNTKPISQENLKFILNTALAGEFSGKKLIYLEAGSGALETVSQEVITLVNKNLSIPLIVGGGIRSKKQLDSAFNAGADLVVIGTAFENDVSFFNQLKK